jgi:hypothetical protein
MAREEGGKAQKEFGLTMMKKRVREEVGKEDETSIRMGF